MSEIGELDRLPSSFGFEPFSVDSVGIFLIPVCGVASVKTFSSFCRFCMSSFSSRSNITISSEISASESFGRYRTVDRRNDFLE